MELAIPRLAVLDSATLGRLSQEYWSTDQGCRMQARSFFDALKERGIFVVFTWTHISELLRHNDDELVRSRLRFFRSIPLIAWLRPYNRNWFPGSIVDLLTRELHAFVGRNAATWDDVIEDVRSDLWETGTGADMFAVDLDNWKPIIHLSKEKHASEVYVSSIGRTDPCNVLTQTIRELRCLEKRPSADLVGLMGELAMRLQTQIETHGDERFQNCEEAAIEFSIDTFKRLQYLDQSDGDVIQQLVKAFDVPNELVREEMTLSEFTDLVVYGMLLKAISKRLKPSYEVDMRKVPIGSLPSYVIQRRLKSLQGTAQRVSGSDLGDSDIAPTLLYADYIQVDKRTFEYLRQIRRSEPALAEKMGQLFRCSHYIEFLNDVA